MHRKSVYLLVIAVGALIVLGLVMLYSTSAYAHDARAHGNPYYFLKRQGIWLGIGAVLCAIAANRLPLLAADLVSLVFALDRPARALFRAAHRSADQWLLPLDEFAGGRVSALGARQARDDQRAGLVVRAG